MSRSRAANRPIEPLAMQPLPPQNTVPIIIIFGFLIAAVVATWIGVVIRLALRLPVLPGEKPLIVSWGGRSVLAVVLIWFAILISVPSIYRAVHPGGPPMVKEKVERPSPTPGEMMTLSGLENLATLIVVPLLLAATSGATGRDFGVGLVGLGRRAGQGALAYPLIAPLVLGVMGLCVRFLGRSPHPLESAILLDKTPGMAVILVLAGVVLAPCAEELIFRGVLLGWLTKVALGVRKPSGPGTVDLDEPIPGPAPTAEVFDLPDPPLGSSGLSTDVGTADPVDPASSEGSTADPAPGTYRSKVVPLALANVAVSIIFAGLHASVWPTPIPIFFLSLGLGLLYQQSGSIVGPIVLHMIFNGVSTIIMFLALAAPPSAPPPVTPKPINPVPPPAQLEKGQARGAVPVGTRQSERWIESSP